MYPALQLLTFLSLTCAVMSFENLFQNVMATNVLEMCVVEMTSSKTLYGATVAVIVDNKLENDLFKKLHESYNINIFVKDHNVYLNSSPDVYIVHSDDKNKFESIIANLSRDWYRKTDALYIIALKNVSENDLPAIFKVIWTYHIIHVLIAIGDTDEDASIYSYLPYAAGRCGRDYNHTIKLEQCQAVGDVVEKLREYDKPDLKNCTFNILAHHYPPLVLAELNPADRFAVGIERFLVELLLETEHILPNFTFVSETVEFGNIFKNSTVTGVMKKLHENEIDLLFGGYSLTYNRALLFDFMCIHLAFEDIFFIVTPKAELVNRWKIVYMMFDFKVWLLILFIMIICSVLVLRAGNLVKYQYTFSAELLKLFGNATQNITLYRRQRISGNVIIVPWLWFMFLINCYYYTRLTSYSTYRIYEPQINEYMSLQNYSLTPCMSKDLSAFLKDSEIVPIIHEQYLDTTNCATADLALDEVVKTSSKYTVTIYYKYLWWASRHLKEKSSIHVMQGNIYKTHYALFFKRGFPFLDQFHEKMSRIVEHGFVYAIKGLLRFPDDVRYASDLSGAFEVRLLTLNDLIIPFSILVVAHIIALVVFVLEVLQKNSQTFVLYQH